MPSPTVATDRGRTGGRPRGLVGLAVAGLLIGAGATEALAVAPKKGAASPKRGAKFSGSVNIAPVVGFKPRVSFKISADGKSVTGFSFGTLGCQGSGGFRPGRYPFAPFKLAKALSIKKGKFSGSARGSLLKTAYTGKVTGRFTTSKSASGTVQINQTVAGGCKGAVLHYSAKAK